jgi:hypothetical protein
MTLTNLQGGALLDLYIFVPLYRYTVYTVYYAATPMYVFLYLFTVYSPYIQGPAMPAGPVFGVVH